MDETICEVSCDEIRVSPFQPRRRFSESELDELAASIQAIGLLHPPVVRKIMAGEKFLYYELIAGERRWRATQRAGFDRMKVIVRSSSDDHAAKATLIENVQRVDLDPIETALAFKRLIDVFRMTQEEVAETVGKKRSTVANYLRLLTLPEEIKRGLSGGEITMGHAKAILSLESAEMQERLNALIMRNALTVREAEKESLKFSTKKKQAPKKRDVHIAELESRLQESLGTKVTIDHTTKGSGRVILHYYNLDDLDHLLESFHIPKL